MSSHSISDQEAAAMLIDFSKQQVSFDNNSEGALSTGILVRVSSAIPTTSTQPFVYDNATGRFKQNRSYEAAWLDSDPSIVTAEDLSSHPAEEDLDDVYQESETWKLGQPVSQPLTFHIPTDLLGGYKLGTISFRVDFNSAESLRKANHARALAVWRAKDKLGMTKKRPSTKGREYSKEQDQYLQRLHTEYSSQNGGKKISWGLLTDRFIAKFQEDPLRTKSSISSHVEKVQELKEHRASFGNDGADDEE